MTQFYNRNALHPAIRMHAEEIVQGKLDRREFCRAQPRWG